MRDRDRDGLPSIRWPTEEYVAAVANVLSA